jgi:hypothetical protein
MNARQQWWLRGAFLFPMLAAGIAFITCHFIILSRLFYPYELEWIEGGGLQVVVRILDGLPVYSLPTPDYVAPLYMPFYYYLSALSATIFGAGLPALRIVSYLAAFMSSILVSRSVWCITQSRMAALLSFLCWGAMFKFSGLWYDVARVDSLWAFLLVATVASLVSYRYTSGAKYLAFAAISYSLAIFTKQTSLLLAPFFLVALIAWTNFAMSIRLVALVAALVLFFGGVLQWHSGGLFYFFTMQMATAHNFNSGLPNNFLLGDILFAIPVLLLLSVYFCFCRLPEKKDFWAWSSLLTGFFLISMFGRWYSGGYVNVLIPFHLLMLIMGVSGFFIFAMRVVNSKGVFSKASLVAVVALLTLGISIGIQSLSGATPTAADQSCGDRLVRKLSRVQGEVCVSRHGYLAYLAGKSFCAHEAFAVDLFNGSDKELGAKLIADIHDKVLSGDYEVLVLDTQAQFSGYGVQFDELLYTATDVDCPRNVFNPILIGPKPLHWLKYNGEKMNDLRVIR